MPPPPSPLPPLPPTVHARLTHPLHPTPCCCCCCCRYIDGRCAQGLAPLHLSVCQGHVGATRALLKRGAALGVRCNPPFLLGWDEEWTPCSTPLHFAAGEEWGGTGRGGGWGVRGVSWGG